jgi:hypothetical protein
LTAIFIAVVAAEGCRKNDGPPQQQPASQGVPSGEPDEYSATIIRTVEDGAGRRVFVTRMARSGAMYREEWGEQAAARALVLRPDLGKSFLLYPDDRTYVETDAEANSPAASSAVTGELSPDPIVSPDYIDSSFGNSLSPSRVEARSLADQIIEGYVCAVTEEQAVFDDGRVEVTRAFRARELAGLAVRIEVEGNGIKVITERRDITLQAPPDSFTVPADFRKVVPPVRR